MIRTQSIIIKPEHEMYSYFEEMAGQAKNLYNVTNYILRQLYIGYGKPELHKQALEVIEKLNSTLPLMNAIRLNGKKKINNAKVNREKKAKAKAEAEGKEYVPEDIKREIKAQEKALKEGTEYIPEEKIKLFKLVDKKYHRLDYTFLDAYLKVIENQDYYNLPNQANQQTIKQVCNAWKSFRESLAKYKVDPTNYTGKPKIPKYCKSKIREVTFTNDNCKIKKEKYLRFPWTKLKLEIGDYFKTHFKSYTLKEVKVKPEHGYYKVEVTVEGLRDSGIIEDLNRSIGIDLGVNNFATISNNFESNPIIIKGSSIKSYNQLYNKERGKYYSIIRMGMTKHEGLFNTWRLQRITFKRNRRIQDYIHKASTWIIRYCLENNITHIVVGSNTGWKQQINIGRKNNQEFTEIPHSLFIKKLIYKAEEFGIKITKREESYTSKASFLDSDEIPDYDSEKSGTHEFSGKRVNRGKYISKEGRIINADVNAAYNILKKEIGDFKFKLSTILNPLVIKDLNVKSSHKCSEKSYGLVG